MNSRRRTRIEDGFEQLSRLYGRPVVKVGLRASGVTFGADPAREPRQTPEMIDTDEDYDRWLARAVALHQVAREAMSR